MPEKSTFKYYAFISYNSKDTAWGKRLQHKLEHYRMPATLCSQRGWKRKPIDPVFFAPNDIQPGKLTDELKSRLHQSRNLIVICSPNSAQSKWVGEEIDYFHSLGRDDNIHLFIIDGEPNSGDPATECFNAKLKELQLPEILGANIHEKIYRWPWLNRQRAYVQLISKLLNVEFDSIWRRHRRQLIQRLILSVAGILVILAAFVALWLMTRPVDVSVKLKEATVHNSQLPPLHDAVVTLTIDNETKADTLKSLDDKGFFPNIPHRAIGKKARITFACNDWEPLDTTLVLSDQNIINIRRNPHRYGDVSFRLWNLSTEQGVGNTRLTIAGQTVTSDVDGKVSVFIPLARQNVVYTIESERELEDNKLTMPTTESTVILTK